MRIVLSSPSTFWNSLSFSFERRLGAPCLARHAARLGRLRHLADVLPLASPRGQRAIHRRVRVKCDAQPELWFGSAGG